MTRARASRCLSRLLALGAVWLPIGCERKAPSQDECLEFATRALGINDARLLAVPGVSEKLDELVIKCLTTPFDKQLIECAKTRGTARSCLYEFEDRERRRSSPP